MKNEHCQVLYFAELGGDARIVHLLQQADLSWQGCNRLREALKILRKQPPALVIADYHYQRNFSMQRSNLDALFSTLARYSNPPALLLLSLAEDLPHLQEARQGPLGQLPMEVLEVPLDETALNRLKQRLAQCST